MKAPPTDNAGLALDTIMLQETHGIPSFGFNVMEHSTIEQLAGAEPGQYVKDPHGVYCDMHRRSNTCALDQYLAENPLSMGRHGYEEASLTATTGLENIVLDDIVIDSPEAVIEHLERFSFPRLRQLTEDFDEDRTVAEILAYEQQIQDRVGPTILKTGHGCTKFPTLHYDLYGYVNYFSAYALYPEVMERDFAAQAELNLLQNRAAARAFVEGKLPPLDRLDHDMTDSRATLVDIRSLDRIWFPNFVRAIQPMIEAGIKLIWHCDGNQTQMIARLIDVGIKGFQGFQYEHGNDYESICRMKTSEGENLIIVGGVSVTRTLPMGTPHEVKREIRWLVECGPRTGLFLGASSSIVPGTPWENVKTFVEGLDYYRKC